MCCLRRYYGTFSYLPNVEPSDADSGGASRGDIEEQKTADHVSLDLNLLPKLSEEVPNNWYASTASAAGGFIILLTCVLLK